jgi:hypothetical protein
MIMGILVFAGWVGGTLWLILNGYPVWGFSSFFLPFAIMWMLMALIDIRKSLTKTRRGKRGA